MVLTIAKNIKNKNFSIFEDIKFRDVSSYEIINISHCDITKRMSQMLYDEKDILIDIMREKSPDNWNYFPSINDEEVTHLYKIEGDINIIIKEMTHIFVEGVHTSNIVKVISSTLRSILILDNLGKVYSMGVNRAGQLGLGDYFHRVIPTLIVTVDNIVDIASYEDHSLY